MAPLITVPVVAFYLTERGGRGTGAVAAGTGMDRAVFHMAGQRMLIGVIFMQSPGNNFKGIIFLGKAFLIPAGKVEIIIYLLS